MADYPRPDWDGIREKFIGLDESFSVKSYYPQLRERLKELEESRSYMEEKSAALLNLLEDFEAERRKALESEARIAALNEKLEQKVQERTEQLRANIAELRGTQDRLVLSEKLAALGRLTAGIAHELNSPLGAIESSSSALAESALRSVSQIGRLFSSLPKDAVPVFFALLAETMERAGVMAGDGSDRKRRRAYAKRLADAGAEAPDFLAELVDEIGAYEYADTLIERFGLKAAAAMIEAAANGVSLVRSSAIIKHSAERAAAVVSALKAYENVDLGLVEGRLSGACEDASHAALFSVDLDASLEASLELYRSKFRRGVEARISLESKATVCADESSLGQVWLNVIGNALQAMEYRGVLELSSRRRGDSVEVEIADSGPGIPESIASRVFEPFFTTKPVGEGNGFGLVVAKRVVERCGGSIAFESRPGRTVFRIVLPAMDQKGEQP